MENKINVIIGDMLKDAMNYDAIAHGANCFNVMGGGIALGVRHVFPQAFAIDNKTKPGDIDKLGTYTLSKQIWPEGLKRRYTFIFNLYTQYTPNAAIKPLDYAALTLCLKKYAAHARQHNWNVALPLIGYGLAGGDLTKIINIMYFAMIDVECDIIVYKGDTDCEETRNEINRIIRTIECNEKLSSYVNRQKEILNIR